ncbi:DNA polymerase-3 subunit epsilon [Thalassobacillus cyri]|uniref:DNA polymerase-3 subunit epsilon n=1 Tax=Thalassobacillus cyri TaxID=571932 RepID=A0A1H4GCZ4_9BACI|nr:3'-5' exonuclease [Thalassobacillus cyri]SEB07161.1 DNA polymerase-3 subunit epsilon [Thalassobacillus cyri]
MIKKAKRFHFTLEDEIPLSTRLEDINFQVVDTEATGFHVQKQDRMIEIASVPVRQLVVEEKKVFQTYVNPGTTIPEQIVKLTGIHDGDVESAPVAYHAISDFFQEAEANKATCLIGHHIQFDLTLMKCEISRAGYKFPKPRAVDTLSLLKYLYPTEGRKDLIEYADMLNTKVYERHTALGDALTTAHLFCEAIARIQDRGHRTWGSLLQVTAVKNRMFY